MHPTTADSQILQRWASKYLTPRTTSHQPRLVRRSSGRLRISIPRGTKEATSSPARRACSNKGNTLLAWCRDRRQILLATHRHCQTVIGSVSFQAVRCQQRRVISNSILGRQVYSRRNKVQFTRPGAMLWEHLITTQTTEGRCMRWANELATVIGSQGLGIVVGCSPSHGYYTNFD